MRKLDLFPSNAALVSTTEILAAYPALTARLARSWVDRATKAGRDPVMIQQPLASDGDAGEWLLATRRTGVDLTLCPGKLPDELFNEVFFVLERLDRVRVSEDLKLWHGDLLVDDSSPRAIALRLRMARRFLRLSIDQFYGPLGLSAAWAREVEARPLSFVSPSLKWLDRICDVHDISQVWMSFGCSMDIELP